MRASISAVNGRKLAQLLVLDILAPCFRHRGQQIGTIVNATLVLG